MPFLLYHILHFCVYLFSIDPASGDDGYHLKMGGSPSGQGRYLLTAIDVFRRLHPRIAETVPRVKGKTERLHAAALDTRPDFRLCC